LGAPVGNGKALPVSSAPFVGFLSQKLGTVHLGPVFESKIFAVFAAGSESNFGTRVGTPLFNQLAVPFSLAPSAGIELEPVLARQGRIVVESEFMVVFANDRQFDRISAIDAAAGQPVGMYFPIFVVINRSFAVTQWVQIEILVVKVCQTIGYGLLGGRAVRVVEGPDCDAKPGKYGFRNVFSSRIISGVRGYKLAIGVHGLVPLVCPIDFLIQNGVSGLVNQYFGINISARSGVGGIQPVPVDVDRNEPVTIAAPACISFLDGNDGGTPPKELGKLAERMCTFDDLLESLFAIEIGCADPELRLDFVIKGNVVDVGSDLFEFIVSAIVDSHTVLVVLEGFDFLQRGWVFIVVDYIPIHKDCAPVGRTAVGSSRRIIVFGNQRRDVGQGSSWLIIVVSLIAGNNNSNNPGKD